jgi:hypothetical protein
MSTASAPEPFVESPADFAVPALSNGVPVRTILESEDGREYATKLAASLLEEVEKSLAG